MKNNKRNKLIVLDLETTGASPTENEIIEIGALKIVDGKIVDRFDELVCPKSNINPYISKLTGITNDMVKDKPGIGEVLPRFLEFCEDFVIVGHNIILFDYRVLKIASNKLGYPFEKHAIDTLLISRNCLANLPSRRLGDLCKYYNINLENAHRAFEDAKATHELYINLLEDFSSDYPKQFIPRKMAWKAPKSSKATKKQISFLKQLLKAHKIDFKDDIRKLSKSQASRSIDNIIKNYGRKKI